MQTVPRQFIDHAETEDRFSACVMQYVESDHTRVQIPVRNDAGWLTF